MSFLTRAAAVATAAAVLTLAVPASSEAAQPNQLCRTSSDATLYQSPSGGPTVPAGSLVRILDYRGDYHYLARYAGQVGQLERSRVVQSSCYFQ